MIEISGSKYMVKGKNNRDKIALEKGHIKRGGKKLEFGITLAAKKQEISP